MFQIKSKKINLTQMIVNSFCAKETACFFTCNVYFRCDIVTEITFSFVCNSYKQRSPEAHTLSNCLLI